MTVKIQHFVLTRFNLRIKNFEVDKNQKSTCNDEWMEHRFDLFEKYCLPSLMHQKNQDFSWFVFFDTQTSTKYRNRIDNYALQFKNFIPVYLEGIDIAQNVLPRVRDETDILVTTRIDNDDAFHQESLLSVRQLAEESKHNILLNFRFGYSFNGQEVKVISHRSNPTMSFVEHRSQADFKTIFCDVKHGQMRKVAKIHQIKTMPFYLVLVHERNLVNRFPGDLRKFDFTHPKEVFKFVKKKYIQPLRRLSWPREYRLSNTIESIASDFNINLPLLNELRYNDIR